MIVLLGPAKDPHIARLYTELTHRKADVLVANSRALPAGPLLSVAHDNVLIEGRKPSALFVRALPPRHPAFVEDVALDRKQRRQEELRGGGLRDAWTAALTLLAREIGVFNPPRAGSVDQQKPLQLVEARALGLKVPRWLITHDPPAAARFAGEVDGAIRKPVRGGDLTRSFDAQRTKTLHEGPQMLQERVRGADVRVTLLDGEVVSSVRLDGVTALDYRADQNYRAGKMTYTAVPLDPATVEKLARLSSRLALRFCGVDLKETDDGYVFLEMNGAPAWLEIEDKTGHSITSSLARALVDS